MKIVKFINANNQVFSLNLDNADIFWVYEPDNSLFVNMGSIQYTFKLADSEKSSDVLAALNKLAMGSVSQSGEILVKLESWTSENLLGPVDVVKLN